MAPNRNRAVGESLGCFVESKQSKKCGHFFVCLFVLRLYVQNYDHPAEMVYTNFIK